MWRGFNSVSVPPKEEKSGDKCDNKVKNHVMVYTKIG